MHSAHPNAFSLPLSTVLNRLCGSIGDSTTINMIRALALSVALLIVAAQDDSEDQLIPGASGGTTFFFYLRGVCVSCA